MTIFDSEKEYNLNVEYRYFNRKLIFYVEKQKGKYV